MSGQDEKLDIIDRARRKYDAFTKLLQKGGNPQLPKGLAKAVAEYENLGAVYNSMAFEEALTKSWRRISVPSDLRPKLERIANERVLQYLKKTFWVIGIDGISCLNSD